MSIFNQSSFPLSKLLTLLAAGCVTSMTGAIMAPVFPDLVLALRLDPQWAGMVLSFHTITIALFIPVAGILADTIGKSKVLISSLLAYGALGISGFFCHSLIPLMISRGLLGMAAGGITASCIGMLSEIYQGESRLKVLGYATSAMTTASIFMPLLGGWIGARDWRWVFFVYGLAIPVGLVALIQLSSSSTPSHQKSLLEKVPVEALWVNVTQPDALRTLGMIVLASCTMYSVFIYAPLYLKEHIGATSSINGMVLAARAIGIAICSAVAASPLAKLLGKNQAIALGFLAMAIALISIPWLEDIRMIVVTAFMFGVGIGVALPNIYNNLANLALPELHSSVMAIGTGFNSLGKFIAPIFLGYIWKYWSLAAIFYVMATIAGGLALSLFLTPNTPMTQEKGIGVEA